MQKFLPKGGATVQPATSDSTLSKEMSPKSDDEKDKVKDVSI